MLYFSDIKSLKTDFPYLVHRLKKKMAIMRYGKKLGPHHAAYNRRSTFQKEDSEKPLNCKLTRFLPFPSHSGIRRFLKLFPYFLLVIWNDKFLTLCDLLCAILGYRMTTSFSDRQVNLRAQEIEIHNCILQIYKQSKLIFCMTSSFEKPYIYFCYYHKVIWCRNIFFSVCPSHSPLQSLDT